MVDIWPLRWQILSGHLAAITVHNNLRIAALVLVRQDVPVVMVMMVQMRASAV